MITGLEFCVESFLPSLCDGVTYINLRHGKNKVDLTQLLILVHRRSVDQKFEKVFYFLNQKLLFQCLV